MDNISTILITSAATLVVTILGGLAVEYFKKIRPKMIYKVTEAVPIKIEDKTIGANVISVKNTSSKTIKDVSIKIKTSAERIQDGGIKVTEGLEYDVTTKDGVLTIVMPFLKSNDSISITTITESRSYIPNKPDVSIRSPEVFKLIDADKVKEAKAYKMLLTPASIAGATVGIILAIGFPGGPLTSDQSTNLAIAATVAGLPNLAEQYALHRDVYYYPAGALAYALARESNKEEEINKYSIFLTKVFESSKRMSSTSRCSLHFYQGKIEELLKHKDIAQRCYEISQKDDKSHYLQLLKLNNTVSNENTSK